MNTSCQALRPQITAFADNSLEAQFVSGVKEHLASCPSCARFYNEQLNLNHWFEATTVELDPPSTVWNAIESRLGHPPRHPWRLLDLVRLPAPRYMLATLALLLVFSVTLLNLGEHREMIQALANLQAYHLDTQGNPFWPEAKEENPFFNFAQKESNPFGKVGSGK